MVAAVRAAVGGHSGADVQSIASKSGRCGALKASTSGTSSRSSTSAALGIDAIKASAPTLPQSETQGLQEGVPMLPLQQSEQIMGINEPVWSITAYAVVDSMPVDAALPYTAGVGDDGPYVAYGDIVCADRYILVQAHVCKRNFSRAPVNLPRIMEFPHMTLARLELGYVERKENSTIWVPESEAGLQGLDMSAIVRLMNEEMRHRHIVFQLHPAHFDVNMWGHRYDITGGQAYDVYRMMQAMLRTRCASLGSCVGLWAEPPAHPHITYEYPEEDAVGTWNQESRQEAAPQEMPAVATTASDASGSRTSSGTASITPSLDGMLQTLRDNRLGRLCYIFERERISLPVLVTLTDEQLNQIGIRALGDRQKVMKLAALSSEASAGPM